MDDSDKLSTLEGICCMLSKRKDATNRTTNGPSCLRLLSYWRRANGTETEDAKTYSCLFGMLTLRAMSLSLAALCFSCWVERHRERFDIGPWGKGGFVKGEIPS
jgi:hypothetical protein